MYPFGIQPAKSLVCDKALLYTLRMRATVPALALIFACVLTPGCSQHPDVKPLDDAGMGYTHLQELRELDLTDLEALELAKARNAGISESSCVELLRIARSRKQPFAAGDAITTMRHADINENVIMEMAHLNLITLWSGEAAAIRYAGFSDEVVIELARRRAQKRSILSGPGMARLKNAGFNEDTILTAMRGGVTDDQVDEIIANRRAAEGGIGFKRIR